MDNIDFGSEITRRLSLEQELEMGNMIVQAQDEIYKTALMTPGFSSNVYSGFKYIEESLSHWPKKTISNFKIKLKDTMKLEKKMRFLFKKHIQQYQSNISEIVNNQLFLVIFEQSTVKLVQKNKKNKKKSPYKFTKTAKKFKRYINEKINYTNQLAKAYLPLVKKIARKYSGYGVDIIELINEGYLGSKRAAEKFLPKKDRYFGPYASFWIESYIIKAIRENRVVQLTHNSHTLFDKLQKYRKKISAEKGVEPSSEELAEILEIPIEKVESTIKNKHNERSLDNYVEPDSKSTWHNFIEDSKTPSPYEATEEKNMINKIYGDLEMKLGPRGREIIMKRNAIGFDETHTLKEIGQTKGISRERVRQLEKRDIKKLKEAYRDKCLFS